MSLSQDVEDIEKALAAAGANLDHMLVLAGVNRSTWTRWKNGSVRGARYDTIAKIKAATADVIARADGMAERTADRPQDAAA